MKVLIYLAYANVDGYPEAYPGGRTQEYKVALADYFARQDVVLEVQYDVFMSAYGARIDTVQKLTNRCVIAEMSEALLGEMRSDMQSGDADFINVVHVVDERPHFDVGQPVAYYEFSVNTFADMAMKFFNIDPNRYEYNPAADMEWNNEADHSFSIDGKVDDSTLEELGEFKLPEFTEKEIDELAKYSWRKKDVSLPSPGEILNVMALHGSIPVGRYLITVSW